MHPNMISLGEDSVAAAGKSRCFGGCARRRTGMMLGNAAVIRKRLMKVVFLSSLLSPLTMQK